MSDNVTGIRHLIMRDPKTGKFERITGSVGQIDEALKTGTAFWIYTRDPTLRHLRICSIGLSISPPKMSRSRAMVVEWSSDGSARMKNSNQPKNRDAAKPAEKDAENG